MRRILIWVSGLLCPSGPLPLPGQARAWASRPVRPSLHTHAHPACPPCSMLACSAGRPPRPQRPGRAGPGGAHRTERNGTGRTVHVCCRRTGTAAAPASALLTKGPGQAQRLGARVQDAAARVCGRGAPVRATLPVRQNPQAIIIVRSLERAVRWKEPVAFVVDKSQGPGPGPGQSCQVHRTKCSGHTVCGPRHAGAHVHPVPHSCP